MDKYLERIATALETIASALSGNTTAAPAAAEPAPAKRGKKTAAPAAETVDTTVDTTSTETPAASTETKPVAMADIAEAVRKLVAAKGHGQAVTILEQFGAKRISEVKPEDFPKFFAKVNELLKAK